MAHFCRDSCPSPVGPPWICDKLKNYRRSSLARARRGVGGCQWFTSWSGAEEKRKPSSHRGIDQASNGLPHGLLSSSLHPASTPNSTKLGTKLLSHERLRALPDPSHSHHLVCCFSAGFKPLLRYREHLEVLLKLCCRRLELSSALHWFSCRAAPTPGYLHHFRFQIKWEALWASRRASQCSLGSPPAFSHLGAVVTSGSMCEG